jgi:hypothetical protein
MGPLKYGASSGVYTQAAGSIPGGSITYFVSALIVLHDGCPSSGIIGFCALALQNFACCSGQLLRGPLRYGLLA